MRSSARPPRPLHLLVVESVEFGTEPLLVVDGYEVPLSAVVSVAAGDQPSAAQTADVAPAVEPDGGVAEQTPTVEIGSTPDPSPSADSNADAETDNPTPDTPVTDSARPEAPTPEQALAPLLAQTRATDNSTDPAAAYAAARALAGTPR